MTIYWPQASCGPTAIARALDFAQATARSMAALTDACLNVLTMAVTPRDFHTTDTTYFSSITSPCRHGRCAAATGAADPPRRTTNRIPADGWLCGLRCRGCCMPRVCV